MPEVVKNSVVRIFLLVLGVAALALGLIGAFVPVLPTTPFVILAAFCFVRSSPKAHAWLYRQPLFGQALRNWDNHRVIARRAKVLAVTMIVISATVMWIKINNVILNLVISAILLSVAVFVASRKEQP